MPVKITTAKRDGEPCAMWSIQSRMRPNGESDRRLGCRIVGARRRRSDERIPALLSKVVPRPRTAAMLLASVRDASLPA
ncbi:hypothetical protein GCM10011490_17140 [Pseudoclavibacter endophyticus]|nr:hypothetical protein GCM10011490_17140 [Pseudoclavibacter endophyticus]